MTLLLTIEGMNCGHCSEQVLKTLTAIPGVHSAKVSHIKGSAQIKGEALDQDTICSAIQEAGYIVSDIKQKIGLFG